MKNENVDASFGSAIESALAATVHPLLGKAAGTILSGFVQVASDWCKERNQQKFENWLGVIAASNQYASAEQTISLIKEHIDESWAHGPIEDAVRAIRDGIDDAALIYLAKLAALQFRDKRPPDRWSRRATCLLLDCDAQMITASLHLAEKLAVRWPPEVDDLARIARGGPSLDPLGLTQIGPLHGRPREPLLGENAWPSHPLYPELFALLRAHQFATEEGGRYAHEGKMLMRRSEAVYLVRIFVGEVAAAKIPG